MPEVVAPNNSQTMSLLEGYLNINPTGTGGPQIAIVDNTALEAQGDGAVIFTDAPKTGGQISVYTVRSGDTLSEIAEMFDVSTNTIVWANDISKGNIRVGQELIILPISGVQHTVKSGDTLASIAKKYDADFDDVLAYNGLDKSAKIKAGDVVIVPNGYVTSSVAASSSPRPSSSGSVTVESGYYIRPITGGKKSQGIHGYNAVDIAAPVGTTIRASAGGTVMVAKGSGYNGGYGLYVVIKHTNGTQTLYGHMSRVDVVSGQKVNQGQTIGAVGNTGRSTGPHIHFEVRGSKNPF
ncbi:MAG: M23 family metallopeptidase [Parcubacteria group bacterium]